MNEKELEAIVELMSELRIADMESRPACISIERITPLRSAMTKIVGEW